MLPVLNQAESKATLKHKISICLLLIATLFSMHRSNKTDGINKIRRLAQFHSDVLAGSVHAVTLAMIAEVKNLRTQVARLAIVGLGDLFTSLKKAMDPVRLEFFQTF